MLILLLTAALLVAGAYLPKLTGSLTDAAALQAGYSDIQSVELELRERTELTMLEKVYLARNSESINVTENDTVMTMEEAIAAAENALVPYFSAGLLPQWGGEYSSEARPILSMDLASGLYSYFWVVYLFIEEMPYSHSQLNLVIDDQTGKILDIYCWSSDQVFPEEECCANLSVFMEIYLNELALEIPYETNHTSTDKTGCSIQYFWTLPNNDGILDFSQEFCFFPWGFYTN